MDLGLLINVFCSLAQWEIVRKCTAENRCGVYLLRSELDPLVAGPRAGPSALSAPRGPGSYGSSCGRRGRWGRRPWLSCGGTAEQPEAQLALSQTPRTPRGPSPPLRLPAGTPGLQPCCWHPRPCLPEDRARRGSSWHPGCGFVLAKTHVEIWLLAWLWEVDHLRGIKRSFSWDDEFSREWLSSPDSGYHTALAPLTPASLRLLHTSSTFWPYIQQHMALPGRWADARTMLLDFQNRETSWASSLKWLKSQMLPHSNRKQTDTQAPMKWSEVSSVHVFSKTSAVTKNIQITNAIFTPSSEDS
jgi:hypothetical protein